MKKVVKIMILIFCIILVFPAFATALSSDLEKVDEERYMSEVKYANIKLTEEPIGKAVEIVNFDISSDGHFIVMYKPLMFMGRRNTVCVYDDNWELEYAYSLCNSGTTYAVFIDDLPGYIDIRGELVMFVDENARITNIYSCESVYKNLIDYAKSAEKTFNGITYRGETDAKLTMNFSRIVMERDGEVTVVKQLKEPAQNAGKMWEICFTTLVIALFAGFPVLCAVGIIVHVRTRRIINDKRNQHAESDEKIR